MTKISLLQAVELYGKGYSIIDLGIRILSGK